VKIAIIGAAGGIGASVANSLVTQGIGDELVLVDQAEALLTTHIMDLEQLAVGVRPVAIRRGDFADAVSADIVVVSASVPFRPGISRMEYLAENLDIFDEIAESFAAAADWSGTLLIASNPVDPLVTYLVRRTGVDPRRILGYSLNDSLRLRFGIGAGLGVGVDRVTAWMLGEHGDRCVPAFSNVLVDGERVELAQEVRESAIAYALDWYPIWVSLGVKRTSTWTSGHGIARMVGAISRGGEDTWPASLVLAGEYGIDGVAVSVPVSFGRGDSLGVQSWELATDELDALRNAAAYVGESLEGALAMRRPS
jgi:malate dehydrogenase